MPVAIEAAVPKNSRLKGTSPSAADTAIPMAALTPPAVAPPMIVSRQSPLATRA